MVVGPPLEAVVKVVFLDIDGVLNTERLRDRYSPSEIDPGRVALLDDVCDRTGAAMVISSDWRLPENGGLDTTVMALRRAGLRAPILGGTPLKARVSPVGHDRSGLSAREREILAWLDEHPELESFAVLDDVAMRGSVLTPRSVLTTDRFGLTPLLAGLLERIIAGEGSSHRGPMK